MVWAGDTEAGDTGLSGWHAGICEMDSTFTMEGLVEHTRDRVLAYSRALALPLSLSLSYMYGIYWNELQTTVQLIQQWLTMNRKFKNLVVALSHKA